MKVGKTINNYRELLQALVAASENAYKSTGHEQHKWMNKAYRHALKKLDEFSNATSIDEHVEHCNGSPE